MGLHRCNRTHDFLIVPSVAFTDIDYIYIHIYIYIYIYIYIRSGLSTLFPYQSMLGSGLSTLVPYQFMFVPTCIDELWHSETYVCRLNIYIYIYICMYKYIQKHYGIFTQLYIVSEQF